MSLKPMPIPPVPDETARVARAAFPTDNPHLTLRDPMRRTRYRGLDKVHVQSVAIAAAINVDRLVAWFDGRPLATTRTARFAMLAPPHAMRPSETTANYVWLLCDEIERVRVRQ